jgi:hypothetical protein
MMREMSGTLNGQNDLEPASDPRRRETRTSVIKGGKLCFGRSLIDCVVLDVSSHGARVRTEVVVSIPDAVIIRFNGGGSYVSHIHWARGDEFGLEFKCPVPIADDHAASVALSAFNALPTDDLHIPLRLLRTARFFDDPALAKAAEAAEATYVHFKATLKDRINFAT